MPDPHIVILYVRSPLDSAGFYARLLGKPPVEASPGFAMFALDQGLTLGLWAAADVQPPATPIGGSELALSVDGVQAVQALHARWQGLGLPIAQAPTDMDFGHTFVALDPDGHRLRVFAPSAS